MKKKDWKPILRIEKQYDWAINELIDKTFSELSATLPIDVTEYMRRLEWFINTKTFSCFANRIASRMVTGLYADHAKTWREAAMQGTKGREIYASLRQGMSGPMGDLMRAQVDRNAFLITSTPLDISRQITDHILEETQKGRRAADIFKDIQLYAPQATKSRISLIARTEVSKTSTALTRGQSYDLGLDWYVWQTSEDARVRSSHRHMDNVLIKWTDPPSPEALLGIKSTLGRYHAGEAPNCRCYAEPVIDLKYLNWPHKVYRGGRISMMRKFDFEGVA